MALIGLKIDYSVIQYSEWRFTRLLAATASLMMTSHAIDHPAVIDDLGEDPDRWFMIGPDRAANLIEIVVLLTAEGNELIIHAMLLRAIYRKLLEP